MKCVEFEGQNLMLMPPQGVEKGTCGQLPSCRTPHGTTISFWRPDEVELANLLAGGHVALHVWGNMHPPVALTVETDVRELP